MVCDVRFAARGARISTAYAKLGVPAEHGLSWIMPRLIGVEWALDLLLSARPVEAEEAQRIGLVSRVCQPDSVLGEAQGYARMLAETCSPQSMAAIRRQVWGDLSRGYTEANEGWFSAMRRLNRPDNPDFAEGVQAFVDKRPPHFAPLPADVEPPLSGLDRPHRSRANASRRSPRRETGRGCLLVRFEAHGGRCAEYP